MSFPAPPWSVSLPAPPSRKSLPALPTRRSFPARPWIVSLPARPQITSAFGVPTRWSSWIVPRIVHGSLAWSGCQSGTIWYVNPERLISRVGVPPSALITKSLRLSLAARSLTNTIFVPSGENAASASSAGEFVSWTSPLPSACIL